jgi:hypothetical protein
LAEDGDDLLFGLGDPIRWGPAARDRGRMRVGSLEMGLGAPSWGVSLALTVGLDICKASS